MLEDSELDEISRKLHGVKGKDRILLKRLDKRIADLYGLSDNELKAMQDFLEFFIAG